MGVMDKFLKVMALNPEGDEEEYYDEDEFDDDDDESEEDDKPRRRLFGRKKNDDDEPEDENEENRSTKILPMRHAAKPAVRRQSVSDMEVCIIKPNSIEDGREIAETLLSGRTVLLNMEGINLDIAQRVTDFTSGACFALGGTLQKVSNYIFIVTPPNVEISGDFQEILDAFGDSPIKMDI